MIRPRCCDGRSKPPTAVSCNEPCTTGEESYGSDDYRSMTARSTSPESRRFSGTRSSPSSTVTLAPRRTISSRVDPVTVLGGWKNAYGQQELDELIDVVRATWNDEMADTERLLTALAAVPLPGLDDS